MAGNAQADQTIKKGKEAFQSVHSGRDADLALSLKRSGISADNAEGTHMTDRRAPRCSACSLPPEKLAELHRENVDDVASFAALAAKYSVPGHRLSKRELRRHFAAHIQFARTDAGPTVLVSRQGSGSEPNKYAELAQQMPEAETLIEQTIRSTLRALARCEEEEKAANARGDTGVAERGPAMSVRLKEILRRQVRELEAVREPRQVLGRIIFLGFQEAERLVKGRAAEFAREHAQQMQAAVDAHLKNPNPTVLVKGVGILERNLTSGLVNTVREVFMDMSKWVEEQVARTIGSKYYPNKKEPGLRSI